MWMDNQLFRLSGYPPPHRLAPCQLGFRLKPHLDPDLDMQFRSWMEWKIRILCITDLSISHLSAGAVSKRSACLFKCIEKVNIFHGLYLFFSHNCRQAAVHWNCSRDRELISQSCCNAWLVGKIAIFNFQVKMALRKSCSLFLPGKI